MLLCSQQGPSSGLMRYYSHFEILNNFGITSPHFHFVLCSSNYEDYEDYEVPRSRTSSIWGEGCSGVAGGTDRTG